jgi:serine/threonine-protein kinase
VEERLGRYELRRAVGRGAAGTVYEAWDTALTRRVAIKVVRLAGKEEFEMDELLARFRQEAQVASRLSHPGVISVYDYGETDGVAFIVMEFVTGETLKTLLDRGERLSLPRAAGIMHGVLLALDYCHRQAIVHRDIKPSNIMLPADGGVKLADFGIARIENSELTLVGTVMGTPPYMSPEQFAASQPVDFRTDIWSAGVVLYEMLTGVRPFSGGNMTAIRQLVVGQPVEPPSHRTTSLPAALDQVLLRALRKAPAERFTSAAAFAEALEAALPGPPRGKPQPGRRQISGLLAGGIAGAVVLAAGVAAWLWLGLPWLATPSLSPAPDQHQAPPVQQTPPARVDTVPAAPPPLPARPSIPAQLAALPCSTVSLLDEGMTGDAASFRGIVGSGAPRDALDAIVAQVPANSAYIDVQTFPQTPLSCRLAELVRANPGSAGTRLATFDGRTNLVDREEIRMRLHMPDFDGEVRLDDLDSDGRIAHLMEANFGAPQRHRAGEQVGLGRGGDDLIGHVSPPYGTDLLVAIVASEPLFAARRPAEEAGGRFMEDLSAAIDQLRRRGGHLAMDALVLTTSPR